MRSFSYIPKGVCSRKIDIELDDDNRILSVRFTAVVTETLKE